MDMGEDDRVPLLHSEDEDVVVKRETIAVEPLTPAVIDPAKAVERPKRSSGDGASLPLLLNREYDQWSQAQAPAMVFREEDDA